MMMKLTKLEFGVPFERAGVHWGFRQRNKFEFLRQRLIESCYPEVDDHGLDLYLGRYYFFKGESDFVGGTAILSAVRDRVRDDVE